MDNAPRRAEIILLTHILSETACEIVVDSRETVARSRAIIERRFPRPGKQSILGRLS
jgi:hypothetical protein